MLDSETMLKSLFNLNQDSTTPDFVIRKRGCETQVFIDKQTKFDMILTSLLSVRTVISDSQRIQELH